MGMDAATVARWEERFEQLTDAIGPCFRRQDLRRQALGYLQGLLGRVERKNSWQLSEYLGRAGPYGIQRLLGRASWDAEQARDVLLAYARRHLLLRDEAGVLVIDETGFLKKGRKSVGVQRQYSGTAGRIENCQIGVFMALVGSGGRALVDRELYLPESWCCERARCDEAGVPEDVPFATKPQLARKMLQRAFAAGCRPSFVLADEVYGNDSKFRRFLDSRGQPYVLAVSSQQRLWVEFRQQRVDEIARTTPASVWQRLSVGDGAKGPRVYDWAAASFGAETEDGLVHWLLIRRSVTDPDDLAYYLCLASPGTRGKDLAQAAGGRWAIETCFECAKQETGLDEYEVRSWVGWYRHITLSMLALAFLAAVRAEANRPRRGSRVKRGGL
jgi:SRSO17 transposase